MKRTIITLSLILSLVTAWSQTPTIQVTGQAETQLLPEIAVFNYSIVANAKNYDDAFAELNTRVNSLTKDLRKLGFEKVDIKTTQFNIRKSKIYDKGQIKGEEFIGTQSLIVKFNYDNKKLLQVINGTISGESAPDLNISFELSDEQKKESEKWLLTEAMKDAKSKAEILATVEGYSIQGVKEIQHFNNGRPVYKTMALERSLSDTSMTSNYQPDDLTLSDQVTVFYWIEKN